MLLSELYEKIGQILKEKGNMPVVKYNPFMTPFQSRFIEREYNDFNPEIIDVYKSNGKYFEKTVINTYKYFVIR